MDKYTLYIQPRKRRAYHDETTSRKLAINFLASVDGALVIDCLGNKYKTKEELENAKDIRPFYRTEPDNTSTDIGTLFESTSGELSEPNSDKAEPSSECDN
jgi:hypothetical protein